jgi:O-antigen/teichoic acid export membrane protein
MLIDNNKRIAKNALILSLRMLLTMAISLYTIRLILSVLGVIDYGIYNVVGGVVVMISFLSNTLGAASQRFFAIEIGRNNLQQLKQTFSLTVTIYIIISIVVLLLTETLGLWFLNSKMVIPPDRIEAANWIYQFSIFSFIINILSIPYVSIIIAREDMKVFALISIVEVVLKLFIVYLLTLFPLDKLKLYAVLIFVVGCLITLINVLICSKKYKESRFHIYWDRRMFKTLISFSGWNLFGALASVINSQGINILLNIFFDPIVNAARGIAFQVSSAVNQFVMNLQTSVNPQIIKYYAIDDKKQMMFLVLKSSKFSFFLFFILSMPVFLKKNDNSKIDLK